MRERQRAEAERLDVELLRYDRNVRPLAGVKRAASRATLIEQLLESVRRNDFIRAIARRSISEVRADPTNDLFDPIRAALLSFRAGELDEACWLVFLATHFGKHRRRGWATAKAVYGRLGAGPLSDWRRTSADPSEFRDWLEAHQQEIPRAFGNHRKYESLNARSPAGTGEVVESYVHLVRLAGSHRQLIELAARGIIGEDPKALFDALYASLGAVARFGRTARFDYLTMLGKLGLAPIEPGRVYMAGATGPRSGARLLFGGDIGSHLSDADLENWLVELDRGLRLGAHALEDALCNWQKSPDRFIPFRG